MEISQRDPFVITRKPWTLAGASGRKVRVMHQGGIVRKSNSAISGIFLNASTPCSQGIPEQAGGRCTWYLSWIPRRETDI